MRFLRLLLISLLAAVGVAVAPTVAAQAIDSPARTQIAVHFDDGRTVATGNAHEQRPILSLSKLHLGYWVLHHGAPADAARVQHMIASSDDGLASELDARYRQAIPAVIKEFGLTQTTYSGYWGTSSTSARDMARFLTAIRYDPVAAPLLEGMRFYHPVAADGYRQDFGTVVLPGAEGTKFGWSNDRSIHASVSFGPGWVAAANTYGSPTTHSADVAAASDVVGGGFFPGGLEMPQSSTPAGATTGQLLDRAGCLDPMGSSGPLVPDLPVPGELAQLVPAC